MKRHTSAAEEKNIAGKEKKEEKVKDAAKGTRKELERNQKGTRKELERNQKRRSIMHYSTSSHSLKHNFKAGDVILK